jgi:adenine C2-methylase RlmN of 23S rRNA A2503 and tRNA A37
MFDYPRFPLFPPSILFRRNP